MEHKIFSTIIAVSAISISAGAYSLSIVKDNFSDRKNTPTFAEYAQSVKSPKQSIKASPIQLVEAEAEHFKR